MTRDAAPPRPDLADSLVWLGLGGVILVAALRMDRLENQDVPPFAAPGLMPGLLGIALLLMGGILFSRSLRAPGLARGSPAGPLGAAPWRAAAAIALCVLFGTGLVGHGIPFWTAASLFVATSILLLHRIKPGERRFAPRAVAVAVAVGLGAGLAITLLFQQIFLVRLP